MRPFVHAALILAAAGAAGAHHQQPAPLTPALTAALDGIRAERLRAHVATLASDGFEGRAPGTRGETLTVAYLVDQFTRAGLRPGNPDGTYVQQVPMAGSTTVPAIEIESGGRTTSLRFLDEFVHESPAPQSSASASRAGIVFAGYGIVAPEYGWNDYARANVAGKLVIVLDGEPSRPAPGDPAKADANFFKGDTRTFYSTRDFKYHEAARRGAAGILVVYDRSAGRTYSTFQTLAKLEGVALSAPQRKAPIISGLPHASFAAPANLSARSPTTPIETPCRAMKTAPPTNCWPFAASLASQPPSTS